MSEREDEDFGFDSEETFPEEGEEFTLSVADEEQVDIADLGDTSTEDIFTVSDEETALMSEDLEPDFSDQAFKREENPEEDVPLLFGESEVEEDIPTSVDDDNVSPARRGSPARLLMLILLVLLAGALGFYFFGMPAVDEQPVHRNPAVASAKTPIALPQKPLANTLPASSRDPKPAVEEGTASNGAKELVPVPVSPAQPKNEPAAAKEQSASVAAAEKAVVPVENKATAKAPAEKVVVAKVVTTEKKAAVAPVVQKKASPTAKTAVAGAAKYQIQVGAYILKSNLNAAEKKVRHLGFEPRRTEAKKKTTMVRLKYGHFNEAEARLKLAELKKIDSDAFILHEGDGLGVYVGSYVSLDKARRYSDILWEKGIHVDEVPVEVEVPLYRLSLGGFPDRRSAGVAAEKVKKSGLEAQIVAYRKI